jgi:Mrp family chromosome partitioning ATPase
LTDSRANAGPTSLAEYAAIVWRRRLVVIAALVGVPIIAVALSSLQSSQYQASADVLLRNESIAATVTGVPDVAGTQDPQRLLDTQARLARVPQIAAKTVKKAKASLSPTEFLDMSSVSADSSADILTFAVRAGTPELAIRLANAYAAAYTAYRADLDRGPVQQALTTVSERLQELRAAGATSSILYTSLVAKQQQLESILAVPYQSAKVVDPAETAPKTGPRLSSAGFIGLIAGLFLGIATALVWEAVEKRPRSTEELQQRLGVRTLGRVPSTPHGGTGLVALSHPGSIDAEVYRLLRLNFEHAAAEVGGRVFVVTSAIVGEGKSTIASNLAVALARAGRSVILVDCDPLRPVVRDRFRLARRAGLVEVAGGHMTLEDALVTFPLPSIAMSANDGRAPAAGDVLALSGNDRRAHASRDARVVPAAPADRPIGEVRDFAQASWRPADVGDDGSLRILTSNSTTADFADHLVATKLEGVLALLRREAEVVILDSAPLTTSVGSGVAGLADGVVLVMNPALIRRPIVDTLAGILDDLATPRLGLVLNGVSVDATYSYGYAYDRVTARAEESEVTPAEPPAPAEVPHRWSSSI